MKLGAQPKQVAWLAVLSVAAVVVFYVNVFSDDTEYSAPPPRPAAAAPISAPGVRTPAARPKTVQTDRRQVTNRGTATAWNLRMGTQNPEDRPDPATIDPALKTDLLTKVQAVELGAPGRNLFMFGAPPPPPAPKALPKVPTIAVNRPVGPQPPPGPPPPPPVPVAPQAPPIQLKYYGYKISRTDGHKAAFLLDGEDILIAGENDVLKKHYRIVKINAASIVIEDTDFKTSQTLQIREYCRMKNSEGGYALLLVYAMAATVAITLYMEIPRAAFEAQRDKEQLLVDRGEQYARAIQLYVRKYNRFPADMQALENTQSIRFLRRQYVDPMTGKNEWRLIHVGPGGVFTDSLVHKAKKDEHAPQTFITELQQIGGGVSTGTTDGVNLATRRRPSDGPAGQSDPFAPGANNASAPPQAAAPAAPYTGPVMVLPDGRIVPATANGQPPPPPPAGQPGQPGQITANNGQLPGGIGVQQGNGFPPGFQTTPNYANQPGAPPPQSAANLINQILTTPRPGGLNGIDQQQGGVVGGAFGTPIQGTPAGGQVIGGGIAGVASKLEREGIKLYGERSAYHEWEFVYDMTKDPMRGGGAAAAGVGRGGALPPGQAIQPATNGFPGTQTPGNVPGFTPPR